ncbi:MAG: protein jag [Chloroflexi bacterium]|nr:protein jag [Chloroflexota bacterium]
METKPLPSVESTGRTVEEAVERGLQELGAQRYEVDIEVLTAGSRGMLGFVLEDARVRLTLRYPRPRPPEGALDPGRISQEVLEKLLVGMGIPGRITRQFPAKEGEPVHLDIRGRDLGILIGRRGETLRALQYLTRMITSQRLKQWVGVVVDVDGYKSRREQTLTTLAERMAEQAVLKGEEIPLEPMPPHERRIIHLALRDHPEVTTHSQGEDEDRRVVIIPKKGG